LSHRRPSFNAAIAKRIEAGLLLCLFLPFLPSVAASAPAVDLHELNWYVHIDLINPGMGEDLAYWQGVLDAAAGSGNGLLEGGQGPFDEPCCTRLGRSVSVATFGTPGDGLDVIDSAEDEAAIVNAGGSGSNAFLVDSMTYCGGPTTTAIGCAKRPNCNGRRNDNPNLWMVVTVESFDSDMLPIVVAHERGHNACLPHVAEAECQLMQGTIFKPGLAGCMTASECDNYRAGRTTSSSGLGCGCHDDGGALLADGLICTEVTGGVCSGGLCGLISGDAGVHLIAAAAPGMAVGGPPDDALRISALKGEWTTLAQFAPTAEDVRGMAYALDSETLYGVVPTVFEDSIVTIDPVAGTISSTVGTIANGAAEIVSMAYDPGDTIAPGDDRLIVLEVSGSGGVFKWIDPASPSTANLLGSLDWTRPDLFTGLAYDSLRDKLFAATPFGPNGLFEIDLSSCPPSPCNSFQIAGSGLFRDDASLGFSPATGMLYLVGTLDFGIEQPTFYNVIDPTTGLSAETLSLDVFTPAGLAAVPEPGVGMGVAVGVLGLLVANRQRDGELVPERVKRRLRPHH
jgi:hypothetical protein